MVRINLICACLTALSVFTGVVGNHLSHNGNNVVNGRRVLPKIPSVATFSNRRPSTTNNRSRGRPRLPVITSRELRTIIQARRIREQLRRAQAKARASAQTLTQTQQHSNPVANPVVHANEGVQFNAKQLAFLKSLFGNDGRVAQIPGNSAPGFVDPRVAFGGHQNSGPPLQITNNKASANPFVIEAKGSIKVSEIKGPNGQTQVIIDATANQPPPRLPNMVTLKPGEDPPEIEVTKFPGLLGGIL